MPASQIYQAQVVVPNADILTLPSQPVEIVPGIPGKILRLVNGAGLADISHGEILNITSSVDAGDSSLSITTSASDNLLASNPVTTANVLGVTGAGNPAGWFISPYILPDEFTPQDYLGDPATGGVNNSVKGEGLFLQAYNSDGDFTGGGVGNTLTITLFYTVIDV